MAVIDPTLNSYALTSLDPSQSYKFRVSNANGTGASTPNTTASAKSPIPQSPTDLTGKLDASGSMTLTWSPSPGATGYQITRHTINGSLTTFYTSSSGTYTDTTRGADGYRYTVSAINSGGTNNSASAAFPQPQYAIIDLGAGINPWAVNNAGHIAFNSSSGIGIWTNGVPNYVPSSFTAVGSGGISTGGAIVGYELANPSQLFSTNFLQASYTHTINTPARWSPEAGVSTAEVDNPGLMAYYGYASSFSSHWVEVFYHGRAISPSGLVAGSVNVGYLDYNGSYLQFYDGYSAICTYPPVTPKGSGPSTTIPGAAVNDTGQFITSGGYSSDGTVTPLTFTPNDINNAGQIVGANGVLYNIGSSVGTQVGNSSFIKINNASPAQILDASGSLWSAPTGTAYMPQHIPDYLPDSSWSTPSLVSMNDNNEFVGTATNNGISHGVLEYLNYMTRDGAPITNNVVCVGQQICLTNFIATNIPPSAITSYQWHLPGKTFKNYGTNSAGYFTGVLNTNTPSDLTNSFVNFYWTDSGTNRVVTCQQVIYGQTNTIATAFNVVKPTASIDSSAFNATAAVDGGWVGMPSGTNYPVAVHFGDGFYTGVRFDAQITPPAGFNTGHYIWLQIINNFSASITDSRGTFTLGPATNLYDQPARPNELSDVPFSDSPGMPLKSGQSGGFASDQFTSYLMWEPNTPNAQYVPLRKISWRWTGYGTYVNGTNWTASNLFGPGSLIDLPATNHPTWTQTYPQQSWVPYDPNP